MRGDRKTTYINGFLLTYEQHENAQGSHRISSQTRQIRVLPDGHTTAKHRHTVISKALRDSQVMGDVILALFGQGLKTTASRKATQTDRMLILLHQGPVCGTTVSFMKRDAARIYDLRQKGWDIQTERCREHNHDSFNALYVLGGRHVV